MFHSYFNEYAFDDININLLTSSCTLHRRKFYERHTVLSKMLEHLGVSPEVAKEDACKLEHDLSDESFTRIKEHFHKVIGEVE